MKPEEMVGQRVKQFRQFLDITQEELGKRVGPLLNKKWSRQTVWLAESGSRAFTASELVALAVVLGRHPAEFITSLRETEELELPDGYVATFAAPKPQAAVEPDDPDEPGLKGPTLEEIRSWPATVNVPTAGAAFGISRSHSFDLVRLGQFPARVIAVGSRSRVVTASIIRALADEEQP